MTPFVHSKSEDDIGHALHEVLPKLSASSDGLDLLLPCKCSDGASFTDLSILEGISRQLETTHRHNAKHLL